MWVVEAGVKGARRITTREFASKAEAETWAERYRRSNSIGSYWAKVSYRNAPVALHPNAEQA